MQGRGAGERRTGLGDGLHHHGRLGDAEPRSAVSLGHGNAEPSAIGNGAMEGVREHPVPVALQPVVLAEAGADLEDRLADLLLGVGEGEVHSYAP